VSARDLLDLVWVVPALPLLGSVIILFFGTRMGEPNSGRFAALMMFLAFVASIIVFAAMLSLPSESRSNVVDIFTWIPAGRFEVQMGFLADPLSVTWILFVTGIGTLIHVYSIGYMHGDPRFSRFFAYLNFFVAAMLVLVLGSSYLVTFLGWEGVGLASYLLISFWFERESAAVAGKKAFVTNRIGDFGFMVAMFLIFATVGTLDYGLSGEAAGTVASGTATAIALLLFLGAIGKSAQGPLYVWLADAMEGPTPVSALIHAATMVTAGVYLVARAHPFFDASGDALTVVAWVGALTALYAGTIAIVQVDLKRVLAFSTISQLGYMFLALGVGAYDAAVFMVIAHACYKGTLFLGAGSVIHGNADNQDMRTMGGLRKFMPVTAFAMVIAWLAIAGVPPFSGFWAKDGILESSFFAHDYGVWVVGTIAAAFTAFYMTRAIWMTFYANERFRADGPAPAEGEAGAPAPERVEEDELASPIVMAYQQPLPARLEHDPHESPKVMLVPLGILAFFAAVVGVIDLPFQSIEFLNEWLEPVFEGTQQPHATSFLGAAGLDVLSVTFGLAGLFLAYVIYQHGLQRPENDPIRSKLGGRVHNLLAHDWYYDETIARAVGGPGRRFANWLAYFFDAKIIDGAVNGLAWLFVWKSERLRRLQTGYVRQYALGIVLGAVLLLLYAVARVFGG
jgi:NADH-quinone oxidoreductase subunit L